MNIKIPSIITIIFSILFSLTVAILLYWQLAELVISRYLPGSNTGAGGFGLGIALLPYMAVFLLIVTTVLSVLFLKFFNQPMSKVGFIPIIITVLGIFLIYYNWAIVGQLIFSPLGIIILVTLFSITLLRLFRQNLK